MIMAGSTPLRQRNCEHLDDRNLGKVKSAWRQKKRTVLGAAPVGAVVPALPAGPSQGTAGAGSVTWGRVRFFR
jgi:hypothetical protein